MDKEADLLIEIFGDERPKWRGRLIKWCDLCECWTVGCEKCRGSTCNCMQCDECKQDQADFHALKPYAEFYLSKEERNVILKYKQLNRHIKTCLAENQSGLDWEWLAFKGKLSPRDIELFGLQHLPDMDVLNYEI